MANFVWFVIGSIYVTFSVYSFIFHLLILTVFDEEYVKIMMNFFMQFCP